ncbi:MAG: hypothetical protein ACKOYN_07110 [Planctomycetota bacterium]
MNDDRQGPSCARDVGARVDSTEACAAATECARAQAGAAPRGAVRKSARLERQHASLTSDWSLFRDRLLSSFFRDASVLAARYRVSGGDVVQRAHALYSPQIDRGALLRPIACVADLAVATGCVLGRANAWNDLWVFAEPAMTRAAFSRLPDTLALTWTRRHWTRLERATRDGTGGLCRYDGSRPIRLWMVEELLGALEEERLAGRLAIRREQLGRPIPLRLVGAALA